MIAVETKRTIDIASGLLRDGASYFVTAVLGHPIEVHASHYCYYDFNYPCDNCGACGQDKRRYEYWCHLSGPYEVFSGCRCYWC